MKHVPSYNLHVETRLNIKEQTLDSPLIIISIEEVEFRVMTHNRTII